MIENTYEFYQYFPADYAGSQYADKWLSNIDLAEYQLSYTAPLNKGDTSESIFERLNNNPPADFLGDCNASANLLFLNHSGEMSVYFNRDDKTTDITSDMDMLLGLASVKIYDGVPGMWRLADTLYAGAEPLEVRESIENPELRVHLLTNAENEIIYHIKERYYDMELAAAFKSYALAHGVSEREVTRVCVGTEKTVVSPDGGLWKFKGMIHTPCGTVYIMAHSLCTGHLVFADKNCNLLASVAEIGITPEILSHFFHAIADMDLPKAKHRVTRKNDDFICDSIETSEDETDEDWLDDDWLDDMDAEEYILSEKKRPFWLRLWDWLCSCFHRKHSVPLDENTGDDADEDTVNDAELLKEVSMPDE